MVATCAVRSRSRRPRRRRPGSCRRSTRRSAIRTDRRRPLTARATAASSTATEPGGEVRASGSGVVAFAGVIAHERYVSIDHDGGIRTTYSYLATIEVVAGQRVAQGDVVGTRRRAAALRRPPVRRLHRSGLAVRDRRDAAPGSASCPCAGHPGRSLRPLEGPPARPARAVAASAARLLRWPASRLARRVVRFGVSPRPVPSHGRARYCRARRVQVVTKPLGREKPWPLSR